MKFNYFRIVITFLAAFGAFFAYVCKLNLSLIINEMVVKDRQGTQDQQVSPQRVKSMRGNSFVHNEEHTLALFSSLSHRLNRKSLYKLSKNKTLKLSKLSLPTLAIEIDVSKTSDKTNIVPQVAANDTGGSSAGQDDGVTSEPHQDLLNWDENDRNRLLGAFFLGYVVSQIPSARAGERYGAKSLFLVTGFGAALCSLVFPYAARCSESIWPAYVVRVIMGATQGALFPGCYVLLCEWLPANERSKWLPWPSAFSRFGLIVMDLLLPELLKRYGWDSCFYVCGAATLVWCAIFIVFGSNSPDQSYWISKQELIYVESHMEPRIGTLGQQQSITASGFTINESVQPLSKPSVSWKKMVLNRAIAILSLVMFTSEWSNMLLMVKLPGFLSPVLNLEVEEIGFWSMILVAIYCIQYPLSGWAASKLENSDSEFLSSLRVRKIFEAAAHAMQGAGCCIIAFCSDKTIVLGALFLMMLGRATVGGGQCLMPPELSRDYPGTVFAYANTIANTAGIIGPITVGWLVDDPYDHNSWFWVWISSSLIFFFGGAIFCLTADNGPQNYCSKGKSNKSKSLSLAQLTDGPTKEPEIFKIDAFSKVASEPAPKAGPSSLVNRESKLI